MADSAAPKSAKPGEKPGDKTGDKSDPKAGAKAARTDGKAGAKSESKGDGKGDGKPGKSGAKAARPTPEIPFVGEISEYFHKGAPPEVRRAIEAAGKKDILDPDYPYRAELPKADYEAHGEILQVELVKMLRDIISTGTPPGVGMGMKPPVYLKPGDVMELGIEGLGEQRQTCIADPE